MLDFEFGDFVIVDGRWRGVVIGVRFDLVRVAIEDSDAAAGDIVGWWNRERLMHDDDTNAKRIFVALERDLAKAEEELPDFIIGPTLPSLRLVK